MESLAGLTDAGLAEAAEALEAATATERIEWAVRTFGPRLCLAASMTDAVLIDLAVRVEPSIEVVFVDTGYHFPETLATAEAVRERYRLNLRVMRPDPVPTEPWVTDPVACCSPVKVALLDQALDGKEAWMSGLRRAEADTRADAPVVARDRRGLVKVNPIATWSDEDVERHVAENDVPVNPLVAQGYRSIGCWPCTAPVADGAHPRSGRWPGTARTECGLHT